MQWLSYVMALTVAAGYVEVGRHQNTPPLAPWHQVASTGWVLLVNETTDTVPVAVLARKVDHTVRFLGWVPARDSAMLRLPYVDTKVTLLVGPSWFEFDVKGPTVTRLSFRVLDPKP